MTFTSTRPSQFPYPVSTSYTLRFPRQGQDFIGQGHAMMYTYTA